MTSAQQELYDRLLLRNGGDRTYANCDRGLEEAVIFELVGFYKLPMPPLSKEEVDYYKNL